MNAIEQKRLNSFICKPRNSTVEKIWFMEALGFLCFRTAFLGGGGRADVTAHWVEALTAQAWQPEYDPPKPLRVEGRN